MAVLGAGVMGTGIAQVLATSGYDVRCFDVNVEQLARARDRVESGRYGLRRGVERGKVTEAAAEAALARMTFTSSLDEAVAEAGLVLEAVPEILALKISLFRDVDRLAPPTSILASNSSGLPIEAMAAATERPGLVIGWHWASPAVVMPMAEIAVSTATSQDTIDAVTAMAVTCGKHPVVVRENVQAWGFAANRVVAAMIREARQVVAEGVASEEGLDQLLTDGWGWPAGPFRMLAGAAEGWGDDRESSVQHTQRL